MMTFINKYSDILKTSIEHSSSLLQEWQYKENDKKFIKLKNTYSKTLFSNVNFITNLNNDKITFFQQMGTVVIYFLNKIPTKEYYNLLDTFMREQKNSDIAYYRHYLDNKKDYQKIYLEELSAIRNKEGILFVNYSKSPSEQNTKECYFLKYDLS